MDGNDELDSDGEEFDDAEDPHDDLRDYAYALVSSNPLRKMMSGRRWKKERVEEVRGRDSNYQDYFFYFCRLVDLPSCYERKSKRFIKCRCIANLDYDQVQVAAGGIGEFFFFFLIVMYVVLTNFFLSSLCIARCRYSGNYLEGAGSYFQDVSLSASSASPALFFFSHRL
jgi:hypothetical protein